MGRMIGIEDLMDAAAVAALLGLKNRNSVATYLSRYDDFPRPVLDAASGRCRLWSRSELLEWNKAREAAGRRRAR